MIVATDNLSKEYDGVYRVQELDIRIKEGDIYGFLGPNGAGKSTTMKMLLGLVKPTSGTIEIMGKPFNEKNRRDILASVGSLIESPSYYGHLTGRENMEIIRRLLDLPKKNIEEAVHIVRMENQMEKKVKNYSLGMKQRLGLCQCLLTEVGFLILDEPFVGLDPIGKELFKQTILDMAHKQNVPVLFSSHDLDDVDEICDRVVMISKGNKQLDQPLEHKQTYTVKIECTISDDIKRSLMEKCGELSFFEDKIMFQDETLIIDIQKILLQKGHYICGFSVQKNNLKSLFGMEG